MQWRLADSGGAGRQAWQGQAYRVTAANRNYHAKKAPWLVHWHMVHNLVRGYSPPLIKSSRALMIGLDVGHYLQVSQTLDRPCH
jgi:hypothetical protein